MKANFTFLESLGERVVATMALIAMVFVLYPETLAAAKVAHAEGNQAALVFEIDSNQNQTLVTSADILASNPLVTDIVAYIKIKAPRSPLATPEAVAHILKHDGKTYDRTVWMRALAISYAESHMCTYTPKPGGKESYNCSGIKAGKGYKMYANYEAWFTDLTKLLQKPSYINRPLKSYLGYYCVPGTLAWFNRVSDVEKKLLSISENANTKNIALTNTVTVSTTEIELVK